MKKWYIIADTFIFFCLMFFVFFPYTYYLRDNLGISLVILLVGFALFAYAMFKSWKDQLEKREFSQLEEDYNLAIEKIDKMYVGTSTAANGFILMIVSALVLIATISTQFDLTFMLKLLVALWVYFFIMLGSRNQYYKKVLLIKQK